MWGAVYGPGGHRATPRSCRYRPQPLDEPVGALREAGQIERFGRRPIGRTAEQVALSGADPERPDDVELLRRLDALGDHQGTPAVGQVAQRLEDLERGLADGATLDETYKENVKDYALRIPYVSLAGLNSILDFRAESSAEVKKLALEKMYDNSLLQEIQKETTK